MRIAGLVLGLSTSFAVLAAVASGCGGSTSSTPSNDSGTTPDVTAEAAVEAAAAETGAVDAAPEVAPVSDACVPDANINTIAVPDASFGDAGATAESCLSCFQVSCPAIIAQCNQSCACVAAYESFASCIGNGGQLLTCGKSLLGAGISFQQLACALGCATPSICGVSIPTGTDSGSPESSTTEAGGDAAGD